MNKSLFILLSLFYLNAYPQDTAVFTSHRQEYKYFSDDSLRKKSGRYLLKLYKFEGDKHLDLVNLKTGKVEKFTLGKLVESFENVDSTVFSFWAIKEGSLMDDNFVRILMKGENIVIIGVGNSDVVTIYYVEKLIRKPLHEL
jgi:hypothetical protein